MRIPQRKVCVGEMAAYGRGLGRDAAQRVVAERAAVVGAVDNAAAAARDALPVRQGGAVRAVNAARLDILPEQFSGSEHGIPPIWKVSPAA